MQFNGEGIQHVAFFTDDLIKTWDALKETGMRFMTAPPDTYYEMLQEDCPITVSRRPSSSHAVFCSMALPKEASVACCCRYSPQR